MEDPSDPTEVTSHKYGRQTMPKPSVQSGAPWSTIFRQSFTKSAITFENTSSANTTIDSMKFDLDPSVKKAWRNIAKEAKESGYIQNS